MLCAQPLQVTFHIPLVRYLAVFANLVLHEYRSIRRSLMRDADSDSIMQLERVLRQTLASLLAPGLDEWGGKSGDAAVGEAITTPKAYPMKLKASVTMRVAARLAMQTVAGSLQVQAGLWERNGPQMQLATQLYSSRKCSTSMIDADIFMLQVLRLRPTINNAHQVVL